MPYNLLIERWMPVRRADGSLDHIAPHEFAPSPGMSPVVAFAAARPDFDGALAQFMIGLLQTAVPPSDDDAWADWWEIPPTPDNLCQAFAPFAHAFYLDGDGPRFLQDRDPELAGTTKPIAYLFLETPTDNTLKNNADHFVKDRTDDALSLPVAAQALLAFHLNAPSGGKGHRTSLRGGGPMTTLVTSDAARPEHADAPLWRTLWLNILPPSAFGPLPSDLSRVFPWLAPTRISVPGTADEVTVFGPDAHPLQAFWGMPRRVRLQFGENATCAATGEAVERSVASYETAPYGVNYTGPWNHPLSPHRVEEDGDRAYLTEAHRLGYADWLGFALGSGSTESAGRVIQPARAVSHATRRAAALRYDVDGLEALGLWAFGFDADNMKIRAWQASHFPLLAEPPERLERLHDQARQLVGATDSVARTLKSALKKALYGAPSATAKGGIAWDFPFHVDKDRGLYSKSLFAEVEMQLWADTERAFFDALRDARNSLDEAGRIQTIKADWLQTLQSTALALFDRIAVPDQQHKSNPQAVTLARSPLRSLHTDTWLREAVGLKDRQIHA